MKRRHLQALVSFLVVCAATSPHADVLPQQPAFIDGQAQPVYERSQMIQQDVWVDTSVDTDQDGMNDRIHVFIVRPIETEQGVKLPVLMRPLPYYAVTGFSYHVFYGTVYDVDVDSLYDGSPGFNNVSAITFSPTHRSVNTGSLVGLGLGEIRDDYYLQRGFVSLYAESLGTGQSSGCPTIGTFAEATALKSVVDWLNGRADGYDSKHVRVTAYWATGDVGSMGGSFGGALTMLLSATGVEGLKVSIPYAGVSNFYNYYRSNGAVRAPGGGQGEDMISLYEFILNQGLARNCEPIRQWILDSADRITGDYNAFWDAQSVMKHIDAVRSPTLIAHGLLDHNVMPSQSIDWYEGLKARRIPAGLLLHQGAHTNPVNVISGFWRTLTNRWLSQYLFGRRYR